MLKIFTLCKAVLYESIEILSWFSSVWDARQLELLGLIYGLLLSPF